MVKGSKKSAKKFTFLFKVDVYCFCLLKSRWNDSHIGIGITLLGKNNHYTFMYLFLMEFFKWDSTRNYDVIRQN